MKKAIQISAIVFLGVFVFLSMGNPVNAITYSSGIQIKNMSATEAAQISTHYYNQDGTEATGSPFTDTIPAGESLTFASTHLTTSFNGSVVIEVEYAHIGHRQYFGR